MIEFLRDPAEHQREGLRRATAPGVRDFAFLWDMGTRKTSTTITVLRSKFAEYQRILRTIVFCPVSVCENWKKEFYLDSKVGKQVQLLTGSQVNRIKIFEKWKDSHPATIFVTNYEALQMKDLCQRWINWRPEVFVFDESQRLKNPSGVRTKMAIVLADLAEHRYILSGTPILNNPMDIWAQYRVLDKGESFVDLLGRPLNFYAFRGRYFTDKNEKMARNVHFPKFEAAEGALDELHRIIYKKAMRVMKDECLDLPDLVKIPVHVEMSREQTRIYEEMREEYIAFLQSGEAVTAQIAITKALRLMQIVSGFVKDENGQEHDLESVPRVQALTDLLEDIPSHEKVIIWSTFKQNYRQIRKVLEKLSIPYTELHGEVTGSDRQANIDRFQNDPSCRAIVANQAAGGVGVTLTAAAYSIYYTRNFSLEQDAQSEARNYRSGSERHKKVIRYDLVSPGTIDEIAMESLANKLSVAEQVLAIKNKLCNQIR
jgi:SNF2 family DNA or RNA helicase